MRSSMFVVSRVALSFALACACAAHADEAVVPQAVPSSRTLLVPNVPPSNDTCAGTIPLALGVPVAATTVEAGNDYTLSGTACFTANGAIGNAATTATGSDVVYAFTAPQGAGYTFRLTEPSGASDLALYTASTCPMAPATVATCLQAANRNSVQASEIVNCQPLGAGQTIFVYVDANNDVTVPFRLEVDLCASEAEPNGTPATSNALAFELTGSIQAMADVDFYSLGNPVAGSRVFALADGSASNGSNYDLRVTSAVDTLQFDEGSAAYPFGNLSPSIAGTPLPGVPVFLRVNQNSATAVTEPYRLAFKVQPPLGNAALESEPNDSVAEAAARPLELYVRGALATPTDVDLYAIDANPGVELFVSLDADPLRNATPFDATLELRDSAGVILLTAGDTTTTSNSAPGAGSLTASTPNSPSEALVYRVPADAGPRFFAAVTSSASVSAGDYLLSIDARDGVQLFRNGFE